MSRRDQIAMTPDEVAAFLDENRTAHLATIGPDGAPHLTTLWYGLVDGRIAIWTYRKSQKVKNLERDPRITALVESGDSYAALRGVMITGHAVMSNETADIMRVAEALYLRNGDRFGDVQFPTTEGSQGGQRPDALDSGTLNVLEHMSAKRTAIIVEPDTIASWDHGKLGGIY